MPVQSRHRLNNALYTFERQRLAMGDTKKLQRLEAALVADQEQVTGSRSRLVRALLRSAPSARTRPAPRDARPLPSADARVHVARLSLSRMLVRPTTLSR